MLLNNLRAASKTAASALSILLLTAGTALAAPATVVLTATRQVTTMSDGNTVPMWGWVCGTAANAACTAPASTTTNGISSNVQQGGTTWQPPLITVQAGNTLTITLNNTLPVQTSLTIIGQLPGGTLGTPTRESGRSPHPAQTTTTWFTNAPGSFTPPDQANRARSFVPEAPAAGSQMYSWPALKVGTYLIESGTYPSIQGPMGLYGVLVVTDTTTTPATAYPGVQYDADALALLSEIDPAQNAAVERVAEIEASCAINTGACTGAIPAAAEMHKWDPTCAVATVAGSTCYPAAVNFTPLYFLVNGVSYSEINPGLSTLHLPSAAASGNVLLRLVNAGLHMHVPSVVGLNMSLIAEDGNLHPDVALGLKRGATLNQPTPTVHPKVQNEVFLAAGKVFDVLVSPPQCGAAGPASCAAVTAGYAPAAYPLFARELSLSAGGKDHDAGMRAYLQFGTATAGTTGGVPLPGGTALAVADVYTLPANATSFSGNVLLNDTAIYSSQLLASCLGTVANVPQTATLGTDTLVLNPDGSFTLTALVGGHLSATDTFSYCGNGSATLTAAVSFNAALTSTVTAHDDAYTSNVASVLRIPAPGVLANDSDNQNYPLTALLSTAAGSNTCGAVVLNPDGSFEAPPATLGTSCSFQYTAQNSQGAASAVAATVNVTFRAGNGPQVTVVDTNTRAPVRDYKWIIEQDLSFHSAVGFTPASAATQTLATSFHRSNMPVIATGCFGPISCQTGQSILGVAVNPLTASTPDQVTLDPNAYYYISILPGDSANPTITAFGGQPTAAACAPGNNCGHTMGGSEVTPGQTAVTITVQPSPLPESQLSIFVFEDNAPTNGDVDSDEINQGLGSFEVILNDVAGSTGMATGQMTYDMYNMPLSNSLIGTQGCPDVFHLTNGKPTTDPAAVPGVNNKAIGVIYTCPQAPPIPSNVTGAARNALIAQYDVEYRLAGHALIKHLFQNRFDVYVNPGAAREAAGEHWIQTSTLEGTHANDAFSKLGEPAYFQEFGSPGYHGFVGFINPDHFKPNHGSVEVKGKVTNLRMSRPWAQALYDSGSHGVFGATVCYAGLNSANGTGANIAFAQCTIDPVSGDASFSMKDIPDGPYQLVVWDQWQDQILEYQKVTVNHAVDGAVHDMGDVPVFSWFQTVNTRTYLDNGADNPGILLAATKIRFRNGQFAYESPTDNNGYANFPETFPLFNWYVLESDTTRFKGTKVASINDAGARSDPLGTTLSAGFSTPITTGGILNSTESNPLPPDLRVPGAIYTAGKTTRLDPGATKTLGFQAFISQPQFFEFGKTPFLANENGGIIGHVVNSSTRPFDDPQQLFQNLWEPLIPNVTVNLYKETPAADGTMTLQLVDTTTSTSWDAWVNGTHPSPRDASVQVPNMNCPGQDPADPFYSYSLQPNQFKCYDGFHNWNQVEPAPYDGMYQFPSAACSVQNGRFTDGANLVHNCGTVQNPNPQPTPASGMPAPEYAPYILPPGKYVVEVIPPTGFDVVKEEDKNILIGDTYIAPANNQFAGTGAVFILPDQATLGNTNPNNTNNPTTDLGFTGLGTFGPGGLIVQAAPCAGEAHVVPDFLSLYPMAKQVAPFAGATRHLCDRKEVTLEDQMRANADFFVFTGTPKAADYTGIILDDLAVEFNLAAPDFGEKFAVPFVPISFRDFNGVEVGRSYSDQYGTYNGLIYSTWQVNPPNPTGYAPNMMTVCMNDPGPIPGPNGTLITDPQYDPRHSNFCYSLPFMPGNTAYLDTPVLPTAAFATGYNPADCALPDTTPAVASVVGDELIPAAAAGGSTGLGPWASATGHTVTITALGDLDVPNTMYSGPAGNPANLTGAKTIKRHYGFGAQCTAPVAGSVTCNTSSSVALGNVPLTITAWSDTTITATLPTGAATGELLITAGNGKKSVDTVTFTIEPATGTSPKFVTPAPLAAELSGLAHPIQDAIDVANGGDLIVIGAGSYPELDIMWKPLRLQGVGAASVIINAAKYPTQKIDQWRARVNPLFGVDNYGNPIPNATIYADPLPGQEITGGIVLLEPTVLASEEGAGITVLSRDLHSVCNDPSTNSFNFHCTPSRIDGISITGGDSGGGVYVNGWAHNLEIANNRIYGNAGSFTGGVRIGQPYLEGQSGRGPLGYNENINIHHNSITQNGTVEANNGAGGAGGGVGVCSGTDNYKVKYNFICGNYDMGDGAGIGHLGLSLNGEISHNTVIFNETFNQNVTTNGGGIVIEGENSTLGGLSLGTGNVLVDSNLIQGNSAEAGYGGGIALQQVNGNDVSSQPEAVNRWWKVTLINNMIANNAAGFGGAGVSLSDTVHSSLVNNSIVNNDSTATAGPLIGRSLTGTTSKPQPSGVLATLNTAGLAAALRRAEDSVPAGYSNPRLTNNIVWGNRSFYFTVAPGSPSGANPGAGGSTAMQAAVTLVPNLVPSAIGECVQQGTNVTVDGVAYNAGAGPVLYWDLGVEGDTSNTGHESTFSLDPTYSILGAADEGAYAAPQAHNVAEAEHIGLAGADSNVGLTSVFCNGSRGVQGIPDYTPPNPAFVFQNPGILAAGTEDEGGNWVKFIFGTLSLSNPANYAYNTALPALSDLHLTPGSPAIDTIIGITGPGAAVAPDHDYDSDLRPQGFGFDVGADEVRSPLAPIANVCGALHFTPNQQVFTKSDDRTCRIGNTGTAPLLIRSISAVTTSPQLPNVGPDFIADSSNCSPLPFALMPGQFCTVTVNFTPTQNFARQGDLQVVTNDMSSGVAGVLHAPLDGTGFQITWRPGILNFGTLLSGNTISLPETFTNWGLTPVAITSALISNVVPVTPVPMYQITGGTCQPVPGAFRPATPTGLPSSYLPGFVPAGSTCTFIVAFHPTEVDPVTGTFTVAFSDPATPAVIQLTGVSTGVLVSPASLTFAPRFVGTASGGQQVTVTNGAATPVTNITAVAAGDFAIVANSNTCAGATLAPLATCSLRVSFTPTAAGPRAGTLTVAYANPTGAQVVALSGTGIARGTVTPDQNPVAFGDQPVAGGPVSKTVTVNNTGLGSLSFTFNNVGGTNFSKGADTCAGATIAAGASCTIVVTFTPTVGGAGVSRISRAGALTIRSDGTVNPVVVGLTGAATRAIVAVSVPAPLLNGGGRSLKSGTITVSNTGAAPLTLGAIAADVVRNSGTGVWTTSAPASGTACAANLVIAAGSSCRVVVNYQPPAFPQPVGSNATFTVYDAGASTVSQSINLFGN